MKDVKQELKQLSDEEYRKFHSNLCPGIDNILGIRVPVLRDYAKDLNKKYSIDFLINNIKEEFYEEIMLKGMLIGLNRNLKWEEVEKYIIEFVPKINNWAVCDTFCAELKITNRYKEQMWKLINKYTNSKNEFEIRFALVMIIDYYIENLYLKECFEIFNSIKLDKYYVKMALAWAISICLVKFYEETISYLINDCKIDDWTYNKSIQKAIESYRLTKKQKEELKRLKK